MGFNSLLLTLALAAGIFSVDAYLNADNIYVNIHVPSSYGPNEASITGEIAESIFLDEIQRVLDSKSFVASPEVRSFDDDTVVTLLVGLLDLNKMTYAFQEMLGLEPILLTGAVMRDKETLRVLMVSHYDSVRIDPVQVDLTLQSGETITDLLRRSAVGTMLEIEPYLTCLYLVDQVTTKELGPYRSLLGASEGQSDVDAVTGLVAGHLAAIRPVPANAERRALFENLLGHLALVRQDLAEADQHFAAALALDPGFFIAQLNRAFVRVGQDRYRDAIDLVSDQMVPRPKTSDSVLLAAAYTTWGVALWGLDRTDEAAEKFRRATETYPRTTDGYEYWGQMLTALGRGDEGNALRAKATENEAYFETYPEVAMLDFWLSPLDDSPLRLRQQGWDAPAAAMVQ